MAVKTAQRDYFWFNESELKKQLDNKIEELEKANSKLNEYSKNLEKMVEEKVIDFEKLNTNLLEQSLLNCGLTKKEISQQDHRLFSRLFPLSFPTN